MSDPGSVRHRLVVPVPRGWQPAPVGALAALLLAGARRMADGYGGRPCEVLLVDGQRRQLWPLGELSAPWPAPSHRDGAQVLFNPAFLLADPPPFLALHAQLAERGLVLCGSSASRELMALAVAPDRLSDEALWTLVLALTGSGAQAADPLRLAPAGTAVLPPGPALSENSPALADRPGGRAGRLPESPGYLNAAYAELLGAADEKACDTPSQVADALWARREQSSVPWIFNTWLNDVELRLGRSQPRSVPPEVHLSITGACNLECRFCGYTHAGARFDRINTEQLEDFTALAAARVLRLNCGIGEPTLNRQLGEMLGRVSDRWPHLGINFFTNALTLERHGLIERLLGRVRWINASLNAATRDTWRAQCGLDLFDQVCAHLRALGAARRAARSIWPLVFGSIVVNGGNLHELPRLPRLCRELGIDRLTAFPYFALVARAPGRLGPEATLAACREQYDAAYDETVRAAQDHQVSLEIPLPATRTHTAFGLEVRPVFDFARVESNEWVLSRFLSTLEFDEQHAYCPFLWRQSSIGSTTRASRAQAETHFLYPCLGPLGALDFSRVTPFRPSQAQGFMDVWRGPVLSMLREAQRTPGLSPVCDACRRRDTRDPRHFEELDRLTREFEDSHL